MLRLPSSIRPDEFESLKIQDMMFVAYRSNVYPERNEIFFEEQAVVYVLEGEKRFIAPSQELHVKKGDILFFQTGCYSMNESIDSDYQSMVFFFNEKLLKEFVHQHLSLFGKPENRATQPVVVLSATPTFEKFVDSLWPYFESNTPFLNQFLRLKFQELLLHLLENDTSDQLRTVLFNIYQGQKIDLHYLLSEYSLKPLTVNELSRLSGRSLSVFKREFEEIYHDTPAHWLKHKRLDHAEFLLKNTNKNVSQICMEVGYESVSHFIKIYKDRFGITPNRR